MHGNNPTTRPGDSSGESPIRIGQGTPGGGTGNVVGPVSAGQYFLCMFEDTTGLLISSSLIETDGNGNLLIDDNALYVRDGNDITRRMQFDLSAVSAGTDRTLTVPNANGTIVLLELAATITGAKTFGTIGGAVGKLILAGSTSGSTIVNAAAVAGSGTMTFPTGTDTIAALGTAQTFTATQTLGTTTKTQYRDTASYLTSPAASSMDIESPTLRLNVANPGDVVMGSTNNDVYPQTDNVTDLGIAANRYRNLRITRILGGVAHLIDEAVTIAAATGYYISRYLEVAAAITLEIGADADLEIG